MPLYKSPAIQRTMAALFNIAEQPDCPVAERAAEQVVWFPQPVLLGSRSDIDNIVEAVQKIKRAWA